MPRMLGVSVESPGPFRPASHTHVAAVSRARSRCNGGVHTNNVGFAECRAPQICMSSSAATTGRCKNNGDRANAVTAASR
eukprot:2844325-Prymnesium_polylepis.3